MRDSTLPQGTTLPNLTDLPDRHKHALAAFGQLLVIMDELRERCPWDKEQTLESLRHLSLEEVYELSEALLAGDLQEVKKELGDLLLHIVFYARLGREQQAFDMAGVINHVCEKLIRRHPHIYGDVQADDATAVKANWEEIKLQEQKASGQEAKPKGVLAGVPAGLSSILKAYRMQEKAAGVGFDWENAGQVLEKVEEEIGELKAELQNGNIKTKSEEFGDLLFSLVNLARHLKINPDDALELTNRKFMTRFASVEAQAAAANLKLKEATLAVMNLWWEKAKQMPA